MVNSPSGFLVTLAAALFVLSGSGRADELGLGRNCVDVSIVQFASNIGHPITFAELDRAITASGFDINAEFRSLSDSLKILESVGVPMVAEYITVEKNAEFPPHAIAYCPPPANRRIGHVVVLTSLGRGRLQVYDATQKRQRYETSAADMHGQVNSIILVTRSYARYQSMVRFVTVFGPIALVGLCCFLWLARRRKRTPPGAINLTAVLCLILLADTTGCSKSGTAMELGIAVDREIQDHGLIKPMAAGDSVHSDFVVTNNTKIALAMNVSVSCGCVATAHGSTVTEILPGESVKLPFSVDIRSKLGPFSETVRLLFEGHEELNRSLQIRGVVSREPLASVNPLKLSALAGTHRSQTLEIIYARTAEEPPAELEACFVTAPLMENSSRFIVGEITSRAGNVFGGYPADIWSVPITFENEKDNSGVVLAELELRWKNPTCVTRVKLIGATTPPLEMVSKVFFRDPYVGVQCDASVPVRTNSPSARDVKVVCPSQVSCLLTDSCDRLTITIRPDRVGGFRYPISFWLNDKQVASLEAFGTARAENELSRQSE